MFYGLSRLEEFFFTYRIEKFIAIAPCAKVKPWVKKFPEWHEKLNKAGIRAITSQT